MLLRVSAGLFVVMKLMTPVFAQSESQPPPYAKVVLLSEIIDLLHCPSCSVAQMEAARSHYVRTAEGLHVVFTHNTDASLAANLLNAMSYANDQCDKGVYQIALDEYAKITHGDHAEKAQREDGANIGRGDGVFRILNPRGDLSSLAKYVVPPFRTCETHVVAGHRVRLTIRAARKRNGLGADSGR